MAIDMKGHAIGNLEILPKDSETDAFKKVCDRWFCKSEQFQIVQEMANFYNNVLGYKGPGFYLNESRFVGFVDFLRAVRAAMAGDESWKTHFEKITYEPRTILNRELSRLSAPPFTWN